MIQKNQFKGLAPYLQGMPEPTQIISYGCLEPDTDGRWYYPIYINGKRSGKSYSEYEQKA